MYGSIRNDNFPNFFFHFNFFSRHVFALALFLQISQSALAQPRETFIEEILVTANKRPSTVQDSALAISALDATTLERDNLTEMLDVQLSVPNLLFSKTNFDGSNLSIRGVGNNAIGVSSEQGAGFHFNGIYLSNPRVFETEFFDLERVEILRGPQGTLYGRNTTAGVVNLISRKAGEDMEGYLEAEYGNYNTKKYQGAINLPLADNLATRLAFSSVDRDGYTRNLATGNRIDGRDLYSLRSSTSWFVNDATEISLIVNYYKEDSNRARATRALCTKDPTGILGCLPDSLNAEAPNGASTIGSQLSALIGVLPVDINNGGVIDVYANSVVPMDLREVYVDFEPTYDTDELISMLEINHVNNDITYTGLFGYADSEYRARIDFDNVIPSYTYAVPQAFHTFHPGLNVIGENPNGDFIVDRPTLVDDMYTSSEQYSFELRALSDFSGPFNFIAGLYYLDVSDHNWVYSVYNADLVSFGRIIGLPDIQNFFENNSKGYSIQTGALFGEVYYNLDDIQRITVGLRYTDEEKEVFSRSIFLNFVDDPNAPFRRQTYDASEFTGKLSYEYSPTDDTLLYASLSRGYKGGGFNPTSSVAQGIIGSTFEPEFNNAIELGVKTRLLDNRLQVNLAGFFYQYDGMQISQIINQSAVNVNADADILGFEGELIAYPLPELRLELNFGLIDSEITSLFALDPADPANNQNKGRPAYEGITPLFGNNCLGPPIEVNGTLVCENLGEVQDLSGNELPNAPSANFRIGATYTQSLSGGGTISYSVGSYWQDKLYTRFFNTANDRIDSWSQTDMRVAYRPGSETWSLEAFVKNVSDNDDITGKYLTDPVVALQTNIFLLEPRTYGLALRYQFQ